MIIAGGAGELELGYEALRAQAVGDTPELTPRGLAVLLRGGMVAWMCACPPRPQPDAGVASPPLGAGRAAVDASRELVRVLTEMALGGQTRWAAT